MSVAAKVRTTVEEEFGLTVGVVVRSSAEVEAVAENNPFLAGGREVDQTDPPHLSTPLTQPLTVPLEHE